MKQIEIFETWDGKYLVFDNSRNAPIGDRRWTADDLKQMGINVENKKQFISEEIFKLIKEA